MRLVILFTEKNSIYKTLDCDCYDEKRNALTYAGNSPVIAHPPCRLFSKMRKFSTANINEKKLAYWAVKLIRQNGGILEHPAGSLLWKEMNLPLPGQVDEFGGTSILVWQSWFNHPCQKKTLLYICGLKISEIPIYKINFNAIEYVVSKSRKRNGKKEISKSKRSTTPVKFAKWLIECLLLIVKNKSTCLTR